MTGMWFVCAYVRWSVALVLVKSVFICVKAKHLYDKLDAITTIKQIVSIVSASLWAGQSLFTVAVLTML